MNILFLSLVQIDSLEQRGVYIDLIRDFTKQGNFVAVVSPIERRVGGKTSLHKEKNAWFLHVKTLNNQKVGFIEKGIALLSTPLLLERAIIKHLGHIGFDLIIYPTPPITIAGTIGRLKKKFRAKTYLMLKDIWPQTAVDLGAFPQKSLAHRYFLHVERNLYHQSDVIGCMSIANIEYVLRHNHDVPARKIELCPNTIEPLPRSTWSAVRREQIRKTYGVSTRATVFLYGGNLGLPQGISYMLKCLDQFRSQEDVFFLIVGSGTEFIQIKEWIDKWKPSNVMLLPGLPKEEYTELLGVADVGLIFLDERFTVPNIPSRMLDYMQASLPILAVVDSATDLPSLIHSGDFGLSCLAGDICTFVEKITQLLCPMARLRMGKNGRSYLERNWTSAHQSKRILAHFCEVD